MAGGAERAKGRQQSCSIIRIASFAPGQSKAHSLQLHRGSLCPPSPMSVNQAELVTRIPSAVNNETVDGTVSIFSITNHPSRTSGNTHVNIDDEVPPRRATGGCYTAASSTMERRQLVDRSDDPTDTGVQRCCSRSRGEPGTGASTSTPGPDDDAHVRAAPRYHLRVATPEQRKYTGLPPALYAAAPIEGSALVGCPGDEEDVMWCSIGASPGVKGCCKLSENVDNFHPATAITGTAPQSLPGGPETLTQLQVDSSTYRGRWVCGRVRAVLRFAKSTASFALTLLGAAMAILIMFWALFPVCTSCLRTHAVLPTQGGTTTSGGETGWSTLYINQLQVREGGRKSRDACLPGS